MRNRTSDLRIPLSDALPLSHRDSTVSKVQYEVHMTRVLQLHTVWIRNVDSVIFVNKHMGWQSYYDFSLIWQCFYLPLMSLSQNLFGSTGTSRNLQTKVGKMLATCLSFRCRRVTKGELELVAITTTNRVQKMTTKDQYLCRCSQKYATATNVNDTWICLENKMVQKKLGEYDILSVFTHVTNVDPITC